MFCYGCVRLIIYRHAITISIKIVWTELAHACALADQKSVFITCGLSSSIKQYNSVGANDAHITAMIYVMYNRLNISDTDLRCIFNILLIYLNCRCAKTTLRLSGCWAVQAPAKAPSAIRSWPNTISLTSAPAICFAMRLVFYSVFFFQ